MSEIHELFGLEIQRSSEFYKECSLRYVSSHKTGVVLVAVNGNLDKYPLSDDVRRMVLKTTFGHRNWELRFKINNKYYVYERREQ